MPSISAPVDEMLRIRTSPFATPRSMIAERSIVELGRGSKVLLGELGAELLDVLLQRLGLADDRGRQGAEERHQPDEEEPHLHVEELMPVLEDLRVRRPVDRVRAEQPAEQQDFRREEQPDAELRRIELLLRRVEVVREIIRVRLS